jgi:hypothetical protein
MQAPLGADLHVPSATVLGRLHVLVEGEGPWQAVELRAALRYRGRHFALDLGGGHGFSDGVPAPHWRAFAILRVN